MFLIELFYQRQKFTQHFPRVYAVWIHLTIKCPTAGSDYKTSFHPRVHFVPGTTDPQCIAVPVTDDDVLEDVLQTFHVALTVVTVDDRVLLGQRNRTAINIQDNDSKNRHTHICIHPAIGRSVCLSVYLSFCLPT